MAVTQLKEIDAEGEATLEVMSAAADFNRWMFDTIRPHLQEPVLEVGSGIGTMSQYLLDEGLEAHLSDLRSHYCRKLEVAFGQRGNCRGVSQVDLNHPDFEHNYGHLAGQFGAVFALNVVEHIADDQSAIANCAKLLRPGGNLIILVPAYSLLYNRFDRMLGHYRRYNRKSLNRLFLAGGMDVLQSFYFNLAGTLGWFISGRLLQNQIPPLGQVRLFNRLVVLFRALDRLTGRSLGLSVVTVGQKPQTAQVPLAA